VLHNETYILFSLLPAWQSVTALLYALCIGRRSVPGVLMLPVAVVTKRSWARTLFGLRANFEGRARGLATFLRTRGRPSFPPELACDRFREDGR
jgi:hypothetical protein